MILLVLDIPQSLEGIFFDFVRNERKDIKLEVYYSLDFEDLKEAL